MWTPMLLSLLLSVLPVIGYPRAELPQPFFEPTASSVMVRPGLTVQLPCRVRHLGDRIVSWIRRKDLHILVSAGLVFTADERFSVLHPEGDSAAWTLQLVGARQQDQGTYECQVNTEPKMKRAVLLTVSDMVTDDATELSMGDDASAGNRSAVSVHILGPREQYVRTGTTWTLTCEVTGLPAIRVLDPSHTHGHGHAHAHLQPTRAVEWLHEGKPLTYQSTRGGVSVDTERSDGLTLSRLTLAELNAADTGRYACKPLTLPPAVTTLIVIEDETTAMLGGSSSQRYHSPSWTLPGALYLVFLLLVQP